MSRCNARRIWSGVGMGASVLTAVLMRAPGLVAAVGAGGGGGGSAAAVRAGSVWAAVWGGGRAGWGQVRGSGRPECGSWQLQRLKVVPFMHRLRVIGGGRASAVGCSPLVGW